MSLLLSRRALIGAAAGLWHTLDLESYEPMEAEIGMAGFGLLLGWAIGMVHGAVALAFSSTKVENTLQPADSGR